MRRDRHGRLAVAAALLLACGSLGARANDAGGEAGRRVSFEVEAAREVANDWFTARAGVTVEDADAARAAARVNEAMQWALARAREVSGVRARSGAYQTWPVRDEGRIRRWRASHELVLEADDSEALSALLGALQERLELRAFQMSVSDERRRRVEEELVGEALGAFRERAALVQERLGAGGYAIDQLTIHSGGARPVPMPRAETVLRADAAPAAEPGTSRLAVSVHATIVLE